MSFGVEAGLGPGGSWQCRPCVFFSVRAVQLAGVSSVSPPPPSPPRVSQSRPAYHSPHPPCPAVNLRDVLPLSLCLFSICLPCSRLLPQIRGRVSFRKWPPISRWPCKAALKSLRCDWLRDRCCSCAIGHPPAGAADAKETAGEESRHRIVTLSTFGDFL